MADEQIVPHTDPGNGSGAAAAGPDAQPHQHVLRTAARLLLAITVLAEIMVWVQMNSFRYRAQHLEPSLFELNKTANLVGLFFELPFVLFFLALAISRRTRSLPLLGFVATLAWVSLAALANAPAIVTADKGGAYGGYLVFMGIKAVELGLLIVLAGNHGHGIWRMLAATIGWASTLVIGTMAIVITAVLISPFGPSITDQPRAEYDAGVILGAAVWSGDRPSPVLRERINRGYDLLKSGTVQFLVLTGGHAPNELPEAVVAERELLKLGADPTRIVIETQTSSTLEQILFIRDQLQRKQDWHSFVIVSDQFHLKRALEICQFNDLTAIGVSSESPLGPQNLAVYHIRESGALLLYWLFGI